MAFRDVDPPGRDARAWRRARIPSVTPREVGQPEGRSSLFLQRTMTVLGFFFAFLFAGLGYLAATPPYYPATSAMLIDPHFGKKLGTDATQPGFGADGGTIDSQVKLLTSQTVLDRVATTTALADDPEFNGSKRGLLQTLLNPKPVLSGGVDLRALEDAITIKRAERTSVVQVDVLARDPQKAADIANALTKAYVADQLAARLDFADADTKFVAQKLRTLQAEIKDTETKAEAYKIKNKIVSAGLRSNEQQITDLTRALNDARAKSTEAKVRVDEIASMAKTDKLGTASEALRSPTIERLRQQQSEAEGLAAKLAETLGERHPVLLEARNQIVKVNGLIRTELQKLRASATADYRIAKENETRVLAKVERLKDTSTRIGGAQGPLIELERNLAVLQASYDRFAKVKDTISQQEADSPPARVIATARPAISPSSPKPSLVLIVSATGGLFVGLVVALGAGTSDRTSLMALELPDPIEVLDNDFVVTNPSEDPVPLRPRHRRTSWDDASDRRA